MDSLPKPRTINDLASSLGVSSMTIHRAIAGKPDIAPKTRDRILAEIERLGWRPNIAARGLRQGKTFTLGILVTSTVASFLPEILQGLDQTAEEKGYHTFVSVHDDDVTRVERHLHTLHSKGVDGLVVQPTAGGEEGAALCEVLRDTPVVAIMREARGFTGPTILVDDRQGGRLAARHLLSLGHRRIGVLGYVDSGFSRYRREGCEQALREAGQALRTEWTVTDLPARDDAGREAVARLLSLPERPTALFCASDRLAALAIQTALRLGLRVPEDVSIVGYNDDAWVEALETPLTTVAQPKLEVGELAARMVLTATGGAGSETESFPERTVLQPWLVARASTGPVPRV